MEAENVKRKTTNELYDFSLEKLQSRDPKEVDRLFLFLSEKLRPTAIREVNKWDDRSYNLDADELVLDTLARAWESFPKILQRIEQRDEEFSVGRSFMLFTQIILGNLVHDIFRREYKSRLIQETFDDQTHADNSPLQDFLLEAKQEEGKIHNIVTGYIEQLSKTGQNKRAIILSMFLKNMTGTQIARALGISHSALHKHLSFVKNGLKKHLQDSM